MAAAAEGGAVVRQGHLRKLKTMKKKFFVLRAETVESSARLEYYESEKKFRSGAAPRRVLPLKSCYNVTRRLDLKQKHVIALFTKEEQLCIVSENEQDLHAWLTAILKLFRSDDASQELLHPIQHVWQVNVQKKGLGASKNIQGLYNLCLTDKTLTLVKIKSHNNIISNLDIPERIEYSLKNIRRCGDSECFFYMEVGRQTVTGAGELWMHSDDSNIAQSMHSTIYHAMSNCSKEIENEKDHVIVPKASFLEPSNPPPARRQTYSDGRGRAGLYNDTSALRSRCDTMPTRACTSYEPQRPQPARRVDRTDGFDSSVEDIDVVSDWYRTPRIPEEPDCCDFMAKDFKSMTMRGSSIAHSRTSSMGVDEVEAPEPSGYMPMAPGHESQSRILLDGYVPMAPSHERGLVSSSGSVCSGTPSTDPRFSEYPLEPVTAHIAEARSARAYSVGSRPAGARSEPARLRAYSAGARRRPVLPSHSPHTAHSAPPPRASVEDLMELDFSSNSPAPKVIDARTPPVTSFAESRHPNVDEYVDMSPRNVGYVEMLPGDLLTTPAASVFPSTASTPDGYVEMSYGRAPTRPIAISTPRQIPPLAGSPDDRRKRREPRTPLGSQTLFHMSMESPSSPPEFDVTEFEDDRDHHCLTTVRELSEDGRKSPERRKSPEGRKSPEERKSTESRKSPDLGAEVSSSPQYVTLVRPAISVAANPTEPEEVLNNSLAAKTIVRPDDTKEVCCTAEGGALHYAALDLQPRRAVAATSPRLYTQIDFLRSVRAPGKYTADAT